MEPRGASFAPEVRRLATHGDQGLQSIDRLADHDGESLAAWLAEQTGERVERARRAAAKVIRHVFRRDRHGDAPWNDAALHEAGLGRWSRGPLLTLSARIALSIAERARSNDGTERLLLRATDGALVESVIIPTDLGRNRPRTTLCISSQVGCARACTFCETGRHGMMRQLSAAEIVDQFRIASRLCSAGEHPVDKRAGSARATRRSSANEAGPVSAQPISAQSISNVVFMGMGEPMDNLPQVLRAIALLTDQRGLDFPAKHITVSTVGVADKLQSFFESTRAELAISLNAPDDARRSRIMPINERFDMQTLRSALATSLPANRRVLFQYAIFDGFNDSVDDADMLAAFVRGLRCRVNVIPANPGPDPALRAPTEQRVAAFVARMREHGVTTLLRVPRGRDVGGACGQLAGSSRNSSPALAQLAARNGRAGCP
jgi:23S rRNA (adenine2503-C2)-methyltransferase